jgi:2-polyprenyl-3-methyl-5-hydroxy-6-metoxy-1,4-benzoquinol methylase
VGDLGAAMSATLVLVGDRLGLYKALAAGALTSSELAQRTGTNERYVREWLGNQGASGYVQYDAANGKWSLTPEQALCLADPNGPVDVPGAYNIVEATFHALGRTLENFKTGKGMEWGEHHACLFHGTERFFRAGYNANLVTSWLPALDGVVDKLKRGARVADVGCGHGASTLLMAKTYPKSTFVGYDYHADSIRVAKERAAAAGVSNAQFEVSDAVSYSGNGFDVIAFFDCLHDMGDPVGVARHARQALKPDGTAMIVEPFANDRLQDNLNPVGRVMYGASSQISVPVSLARKGPALGAQAGEAKLREVVVKGGGFARARVAGAQGPRAGCSGRGSQAARSGGERRWICQVQARHRNAVQSGARGAALRAAPQHQADAGAPDKPGRKQRSLNESVNRLQFHPQGAVTVE